MSLAVVDCRRHALTGEFITAESILLATVTRSGTDRVLRYKAPPRLGNRRDQLRREVPGLVRLNVLRATARKGSEERPESLVGREHLLERVKVADCLFVQGDVAAAAKEFPMLPGDAIVEDSSMPGLRMHCHADGLGYTFYVDRRINRWLTRRRSHNVNDVLVGHEPAPEHLCTNPDADLKSASRAAAKRAAAELESATPGSETQPGDIKEKRLGDTKENEQQFPEFMSEEMRESISQSVLREDRLQQVKQMLQASETACDDLHKFNPTEFRPTVWN